MTGACYIEGMSEEVLALLTGSGIRIEDRDELEEFLSMPDAKEAVAGSSFEQVFFTVKALGLPDALDLLPLVSARQICGFIDLDCWRKDSFVRKPFMEWIAAFVQAGPEETARALSGIDYVVVALFLKNLITVYEIERDEPPPATQLLYSPDNSLAVEQTGSGDAATISTLILDALFKYNPDLGYAVLRKVRYTTRIELEETAYQNKVRRLDVHGFVDYYEALSIYAGSERAATSIRPREDDDDEIPGEESPRSLPTVFADSLSGGGYLLTALSRMAGRQADRVAEELTALGNRILSANLVNLGEVEGIRVALGEMRDFLTIGLEHLSGGEPAAAARLLEENHAQAIFKAGFDLLAGLRGKAERLARLPGFKPELLEHPEQEFVAGLARFKPLLWDQGRYRGFRELREVRDADARIERIRAIVGYCLASFGPSIGATLRQAFNTAVVRQIVSGRFDPTPLETGELERAIADGVTLAGPQVPDALRDVVGEWLEELRSDLEPLVGKDIDPRFVGFVRMKGQSG